LQTRNIYFGTYIISTNKIFCL